MIRIDLCCILPFLLVLDHWTSVWSQSILPSRCRLEHRTMYITANGSLVDDNLDPDLFTQPILPLQMDRQQSTSIYEPVGVTIPQCSGSCGQSSADVALHKCVPSSIRWEAFTQTVQSIRPVPAPMSNSIYQSGGEQMNQVSRVQLDERIVKLPVHTACQCQCRSNPTGVCGHPMQAFHVDKCRCECRDDSAPNGQPPSITGTGSNQFKTECDQVKIPGLGSMFWDQHACKCRCPQLREHYLGGGGGQVPRIGCLPGGVFSETECRFVLGLSGNGLKTQEFFPIF